MIGIFVIIVFLCFRTRNLNRMTDKRIGDTPLEWHLFCIVDIISIPSPCVVPLPPVNVVFSTLIEVFNYKQHWFKGGRLTAFKQSCMINEWNFWLKRVFLSLSEWVWIVLYVLSVCMNPKVHQWRVLDICDCERFEPRSHFKSRLSLIVRVNVVM